MLKNKLMVQGRWILSASLVVAVMVLATVPGSASSVTQPHVVSDNPANFTPNINDGATYKMLQVGSTLYAGGSFSSVTTAGTGSVARSHLLAFSATTGVLGSFAPTFDDNVWALASDGTSLFVGGEFKNVNGVPRAGLAKFSLATGQLDPSFVPALSGPVYDAVFSNNRLIISGSFAKRLAAIDPASGSDTGFINLGISGSVSSNAGRTEVYRISVNTAGSRLVGVGNFTTVAGQTRYRALMVNLDTPTATLNPWNYAPLAQACDSPKIPDYLRDVDFAPNGSYFVIVATGSVPQAGQVGTAICDAAARFETNVANPSQPTWINYTGGDTLHSVAVSGSVVYVQGHQRWLNNPDGFDAAGPGAVDRPGIGALDPNTGLALDWNPGKQRGVGGRDLLLTEKGLWVGSDTSRFAGELRQRIAFCPL